MDRLFIKWDQYVAEGNSQKTADFPLKILTFVCLLSMRDFVWTIIVIWLIYKVVDVFRGPSKKKFDSQGDAQGGESTQTNTSSHNEKDIRSAVQKHLNNEGEYVDFEEMK